MHTEGIAQKTTEPYGIFDKLTVAYCVFNDDNELVSCNTAWAKLFGLERKAAAVALFDSFIPPDSQENLAQNIKLAFETGNARFRLECLRADKTEVFLDITLSRETDSIAAGHAVETNFHKIRDFSEMNDIILESSPYAMDLWNEDLKLVGCNKQMLELFGLKDQDEYRARFFELLPPTQPTGIPSAELAMENIKLGFLNGRHRSEFMLRSIHTGAPMPVEVTMVKIVRLGKPLLACYLTDLRLVKAAMEKLREADERSSVLMRAMPFACVLLNTKYEAVECNPSAVSLFAVQQGKPFLYRSETQGLVYCDDTCATCLRQHTNECVAKKCLITHWNNTIPDNAKNPERVAKSIENSCKIAIEAGSRVVRGERLTLYGEPIYCETTILPVMYQSGTGFAIYIKDLRESQMREAAEEESRAKTQFLARMSHEIRTPMNAVIGITEIQLLKGSHPPETEEAFLRIKRSSSLLLNIINDILDLSKVEAGRMEIIPFIYDFSDMIINTVQINLMHIGSKNIDFSLKVSPNIPRSLVGDELRIKQILNNLLSNAFKYTNEGEVILEFEAEDTPEGDEIILVVNVRDTGQGMTKAQIGALFEEFQRFNTRRNQSVEGTGLGMSITQHLITLMNGTISVHSDVGQGTTFTVRLPQVPNSAEVLGERDALSIGNLESVKESIKKSSKIKREPMPYGRVLVVDDVESNLYVSKGLMQPYKLVVETADSGQEALDLVKAGNIYDIIFMDHMMPGMDGIETASAIWETGYSSPIVALTANIVKGQAEIFINNGFAGFVSKPIDPNHLDSYLTRYIRDKQPPEVLAAANVVRDFGKISMALENSSELVQAFLRDAKKARDILGEIAGGDCFDEKDLKLYTTYAHAIKSALANIGEGSLSDFAYSLEEAGRKQERDKIKAETAHFLERLHVIVEARSPIDLPDVPEDNPVLLRVTLKEIHRACEAFDKKAAKKALDSLSSKIRSKKTRDMLNEIAALIRHSDFEAAAELAIRNSDVDAE